MTKRNASKNVKMYVTYSIQTVLVSRRERPVPWTRAWWLVLAALAAVATSGSSVYHFI